MAEIPCNHPPPATRNIRSSTQENFSIGFSDQSSLDSDLEGSQLFTTSSLGSLNGSSIYHSQAFLDSADAPHAHDEANSALFASSHHPPPNRKLTPPRIDLCDEIELFDLDLVSLDFSGELLKLLRSTTKSFRTLPQRLRSRLHSRKQRLLLRAKSVYQKVENFQAQKILQKICFVILFCNVIVTSFVLGKFPAAYFIWHSFKLVLLLLIRLFVFRLKRFHYYMFDFCYYANALLLLYLWTLRRSEFLWNILQGFSGMLGLSVSIFGDAIMPHSLQRVTSAELHLSYLLVLWTLRWYPQTLEGIFFEVSSYGIISFPSSFDVLWNFFMPPISAYIVWAVLYYSKIFFISRSKIEERNYATLYNYFAADRSFLESLPASLRKHPRLLFICGHGMLFFIGLSVVPIICESFWTHTLFLVFTWTSQIYNGANFYVELFSKYCEQKKQLIGKMKDDIGDGSC